MLTQPYRGSLDVFQLRGLRKFLRTETNFVEPTETTSRLLAQAEAAPNHGRRGDPQKISWLTQVYLQRGRLFLAKVICLPPDDP
eukprot:12896422-Prorocentrum_lima.AAC.1